MKENITNTFKKLLCSVMLSCFVFLAGCGGEETDGTGSATSEYYDIEATEKEIASPSEADDNWRLLNSQFYQGKPVQIWSAKGAEKASESGKSLWDVYLYYEDESKELLVSGITSEYMGSWYVGEDIYIRNGKKLTRMQADGTILYTKNMDSDIQDICPLSDGRVLLIVKTEDETMKLAELNPQDGTITEKNTITLGKGTRQLLGESGDGLVLLDSEGLWSLDITAGKKEQMMKMNEGSYTMDAGVMDFLVLEENQVQILYNGKMETLQLSNVTQEKARIIVRDWKFDSYMKTYVAKFNRQSEKYVVQLQQCDSKTSTVDFYNETNIQIGTGGGADIIFGGAMGNVSDLLEKGVLVDLKPYMESSGIMEEDYFPAAFEGWRDGDKIYGVSMYTDNYGIWVDESMVGEDGTTDIETLVDTLLARKDEAIFKEGWDAAFLLDYFFKGTEDLWGMIDWEKAECDFDTELFAKLLKVAKRYGVNEKNAGYPALSEFVRTSNFYEIETKAELQSEGKSIIGVLFDDGCYIGIHPSGLMGINVNSPNKEGAWEFIEFLICESTQSSLNYYEDFPVNIKGFEAMAEREMTEGSYVETQTNTGTKVTVKAGDAEYARKYGGAAYRELYDITPEIVADAREFVENMKALPIHTTPLRNIILEEAAQYFNDVKSIEEIIPIIENRVQLYLDEHN